MGYDLATHSMSQLMDEAASPEIQARIREAIKANAGGALQAHDIRTRTAGPADLHRVPPGGAGRHVGARPPTTSATAWRTRSRPIDRRTVVIHVEPEHKAKHKGAVEV